MAANPPALIPAHRRAVILKHVRAAAGASIPDLARITGASASTIRRDLERLEHEGHLRRAHGGALLDADRSRFEPDIATAAETARAEKEAIGRAAAERLSPGESVIFDSGSTVRAAARAAAARSIALTAVTNDLGVARIFAGRPEVQVIVPGGQVRAGSLTLLGEPGLAFLREVRADIVLLGTHAIADGALSDTSVEVAAMKRAMIAAGRRVILLADADKFRTAAFFRIAALDAIDELITDGRADATALKAVCDAGVAVTVAGLRREGAAAR